MNIKNASRLIDHTLLRPDSSESDVKKLCREAIEYEFSSVCVNPYFVPIASKLLQGTNVKVCTVIGFPLGANTSRVKEFEAKEAVQNGAEEIDMVINIGALKSGHWQFVEKDIKTVVNAVPNNICVKVILETCLLTRDEIKKASELAKKAGADFVKTSTGFSTSGAKIDDVKIMFDIVSPEMEVKASGGIRTLEDLISMVEAGASRIGASSSVDIIKSIEVKGNES